MRMPLLVFSAEVLLDTYGLYHMTQLQADPELSELTEAFRQTQERLKTSNEQHRPPARSLPQRHLEIDRG